MKSWLIVDDSKVVRMVARKILEELGFETSEAADGQQAVDSCTVQMPDAILLDWNMPVMDGLEFLRALRARAFSARALSNRPARSDSSMRRAGSSAARASGCAARERIVSS
jgi:CheY-like chemotaxis protein